LEKCMAPFSGLMGYQQVVAKPPIFQSHFTTVFGGQLNSVDRR
jgi:hypothetical protein